MLGGEVEPPALSHEERLLVKDGAVIAERLEWSPDVWRTLTDELKAMSGKKGRELFHPLRLALTGRDSGPEMAGLVAADGQGARGRPPRSRRQALGLADAGSRPYFPSMSWFPKAVEPRALRSAISSPSFASASASM